MLQEYIDHYCEGHDFEPNGTRSFTVGSVEVTLALFSWRAPIDPVTRVGGGGEKAILTLTRGDRRYECTCVDLHHWNPDVFALTYKGRELICFRKTLYGFTLVDAETMTEIYDYFPEKVMKFDESFIICKAASLGDLMIFHGCYWACPYSIYVYDHEAKRFLDLFTVCRMDYDSFSIEDGKLIAKGVELTGEKTPRSFTATEAELRRLLEAQGEDEF